MAKIQAKEKADRKQQFYSKLTCMCVMANKTKHNANRQAPTKQITQKHLVVPFVFRVQIPLRPFLYFS